MNETFKHEQILQVTCFSPNHGNVSAFQLYCLIFVGNDLGTSSVYRSINILYDYCALTTPVLKMREIISAYFKLKKRLLVSHEAFFR